MSKLRAALYRAARTVAQTAAALLPATAVVLSEVDWRMIASGALLAGIASLLTSAATDLPEAG